jgi:hypothetical protein
MQTNDNVALCQQLIQLNHDDDRVLPLVDALMQSYAHVYRIDIRGPYRCDVQYEHIVDPIVNSHTYNDDRHRLLSLSLSAVNDVECRICIRRVSVVNSVVRRVDIDCCQRPVQPASTAPMMMMIADVAVAADVIADDDIDRSAHQRSDWCCPLPTIQFEFHLMERK